MKWTIIADPQFDDQPTYSKPLPNGLTSRLRDSIECFETIVAQTREHGCQGILVLGDIFDSRTSISLSVIDQVCRSFKKTADLGLEIHVLVGNHDSQLRVPTINSLQAFLGMATVWEKPSCWGKFAFMPWVEDEQDFRDSVSELAEDKDAEFLFSHALFEGAVPKVAGRPISDLMPERWRQVVLGDVHEPIQVAANVQYCGAPMHIHYGDAGGKRGYFVLDDESGTLEFHENTWSPRFHIIDENMTEDAVQLQVRPGDFVRIKTSTNSKAAMRLVDAAKEATDWVESFVVEIADDAPRIRISTRDSFEDVVKEYLVYQELEDVPGLPELAAEILEEASK